MAITAARSMAVAPWAPTLDSALRKLRAATPGRSILRLEEYLGKVSASARGLHPYEAGSHILSAILEALEASRALSIQYATPGRRRPRLRTVHPYQLRLARGGLYLVGWDDLREAVCTFLVDRIRMAAVTETRFDPPADFDAEAYFRDAFDVHRGGPVVELSVHVSDRIVHLLEERRWHPSQRLRRLKRGARLTLRVRDTPELRAWLKSFGSDLVVLAPESVARALREDAERLLREYAERRVRTRPRKARKTPRGHGRHSGTPASQTEDRDGGT